MLMFFFIKNKVSSELNSPIKLNSNFPVPGSPDMMPMKFPRVWVPSRQMFEQMSVITLTLLRTLKLFG